MEVALQQDLLRETERTIAECRLISQGNALPPLAQNRNKCFGCSLNAICLPEEEEVSRGRKDNARAVMPMTQDGDVLYVDTIGAWIGLSEGHLKVSTPEGGDVEKCALEALREVNLCGPVQMTTQALHACLYKHIPVHYLSFHGTYVGTATNLDHKHGILRRAQWEAHFDPQRSLEIAKVLVISKITNMRTLMMRYVRDDRDETHEHDIRQLNEFRKNPVKPSPTTPCAGLKARPRGFTSGASANTSKLTEDHFSISRIVIAGRPGTRSTLC